MSRYSDDRLEALRSGSMNVDKRTRNLVAAFQSALQGIIPTYRVTGYKPLNEVNIRVTYTAPVWLDEPQRAVLTRHSHPQPWATTEVWTARKFEDRGHEVVRFEVDPLTWEFVR